MLGCREIQVYKETRVQEAVLDQQGLRDLGEMLARQDLLDQQGLEEMLVYRVLLDRLDPLVHQELLELQVSDGLKCLILFQRFSTP